MSHSSILRAGVVAAIVISSGLGLTGCDDGPQIVGRVWDDRNSNGVMNAGEPGVAGVRVNLDCLPDSPNFGEEDADLERCQSTTTDAGGEYRFSFPSADDGDLWIRLEFVAPAGFAFTSGGGSDADPTTGLTEAQLYHSELRGFDAGLVAVGETSSGTSPPANDPESVPVDELCVLYDRRSAILSEIGPAVDPTAFEAQTRITEAFYGEAAALVDEPEASAFRAMFEYFQALVAFHELRGWNPDLLARIDEPRLPVEASGTVNTVLRDRSCIAPPPGGEG
jgi:hypothetical protein